MEYAEKQERYYEFVKKLDELCGAVNVGDENGVDNLIAYIANMYAIELFRKNDLDSL